MGDGGMMDSCARAYLAVGIPQESTRGVPCLKVLNSKLPSGRAPVHTSGGKGFCGDSDYYYSITDDCPRYELNLFTLPKQNCEDLEYVLIPRGIIVNRVERLAKDIWKDIGHCDFTIVYMCEKDDRFFLELVDYIKNFFQNSKKFTSVMVYFMKLQSNGNDQSTEELKIIESESLSTLAGKNILIVENIIGTGRTMKALLSILEKYRPNTIKVASLFVKRTPRKEFRPDYVGFEIPNLFVMGYTLSYKNYFRNLRSSFHYAHLSCISSKLSINFFVLVFEL
ncbi:PREDICTED: phosphoribosyltransferase domain-containing protein 1 [Condylura cristata]|uniref:phosphoribosyltransferase domain-containing protein 1 n=1 Tax=Condylura cristata TaxID=143302 RepID=UPI000642DAE3|nr:PREDICTED: phosphoribosyltransferase domain-containing protein 1 [Condylura cristata]